MIGSGSAAAAAAPAGFSAARPAASAPTTVEHAGALSRAAESRSSPRLLLIRAAGNTACVAITGALPCAAACSPLRFLLIRAAGLHGPALSSLVSPPPATTAPESRSEREDREARRSFDSPAAASLPPLPSPAVPLLRFLLIRGEGGAPTLLFSARVAPPTCAPLSGREDREARRSIVLDFKALPASPPLPSPSLPILISLKTDESSSVRARSFFS